MTFGSEPRRRRWSPDSPRRSADGRHAVEDDDAESWLAGIRPDRDDESWPAGIRPDRHDEAWPAGSRPDRHDEPQRRRRPDRAGSADWPPPTEPAAPSAAPTGTVPLYGPSDGDRSGRHADTGEQEPRGRFRVAGEPRPRAAERPSPATGSWSPPAERPSPAAEPRPRAAERPSPAAEPRPRAAERPSPATGSWPPPAEERRVGGRRRVPESDDVPARDAGPGRATASASVPVRGAPRPPVSASDQSDRVIRPRGRAAVSGRVGPPGPARVPPRTGDPSVAAPSGPVRTGRRPDRTVGRAREAYPSTATERTPARARRDTAAGGVRPRPTWQSSLLGVISVLVLAAVAFGGYLLINGGRASSPAKRSTAGPVVKPRDISSRDVDPAPLTEQEVFPGQQLAVRSSTYQILKTQATDCQTAATGDLAKLLTDLGCSQVVRGTLKSPDSQFLVTAGIVNLKDEASANQAYESVKPMLDAQKGRFTGLAAGDGTDALVRAPTTLGWHPRGHFLAYCVVARADGKPIAADDPDSKQVISDVVEGYLRDEVLGARAATPVSAPK